MAPGASRERRGVSADDRTEWLERFRASTMSGGVVTIGAFDGVHRGHRSLIGGAVDRARSLNIPSAAVTFEPIPAFVLRPERFLGRICTAIEKQRELAALGLDDVVTLRFDLDLARRTPSEFMNALSEHLALRELWVGEAFALGRDRTGDIERLREIGAELDFEVVAVARLVDDGAVVSSSAIRAAIVTGDVALVRTLLGRPFRVTGEVIHGAYLGRTIGFPTANVVPQVELAALADGIYVSMITLPGETAAREAMTYVGTRPTVKSGDRLIETNILDFSGDLYGQIVTVDFLHRLRGDESFDGLDALVAQLRLDEASTRAFLRGSDNIPD